MSKPVYPEKKIRELSESEKVAIRARASEGESNIFKLAAEFVCSSSQIAGVQARMK